MTTPKDATAAKSAVVVTPTAYVSMLMHAACYGTTVVHGILLGNVTSDAVVTVTRALPVCHEAPTKPLVDTALALVQASLTKGEAIVGWYTAPERLEDDRPGSGALRIAAALDSTHDFEPILVLVRNEQLTQIFKSGSSETSVFKVFGKDFGKQWLETLDNVTVEKESNAIAAAREAYQQGYSVTDLVKHWETPDSSDDWLHNTAIAQYVDKHC